MLKSFLTRLCTVAIAICCTMTIATSCSDDEEAIPVSDVSFDDPALLLIEGQKQTLKAIITPQNATNKKVTWQSSATAVATVNELGIIEAKSVGTTTITATTVDGGKTITCEVTVQKPAVSVTGVSLNKAELLLLLGEKETLAATITPADATIKAVIWESSNDAVATVSESGEVVAKSVGTAIITVTTLDGGKKATCSVTVDASEFAVKFESNGGSKVDEEIVKKGETLTEPKAPAKGEGLYLGVVDPTTVGFTFEGWYTDQACTAKYNFSTPVTTVFTLYAKWKKIGTTDPIDVQSATGTNILAKAYNYLNTLALAAPAEYTFVLTDDIECPGLPDFKNLNATFLLIGKGQERKISKAATGTHLFSIWGGTFIVGDKITLTGTNYSGGAPLHVNGTGKVIMRDGGKISDVRGNVCAVLIGAGGASFTMEGGEIIDNVIERDNSVASGAVCATWGSFYMKGGLIARNSVKKTNSSHNIGGAVSMYNNQVFTKTGGKIEGNSAVIDFAGTMTRRTGQQVFVGETNDANKWWKVDNNLGENDNLSSSDTSNPLWIKVN